MTKQLWSLSGRFKSCGSVLGFLTMAAIGLVAPQPTCAQSDEIARVLRNESYDDLDGAALALKLASDGQVEAALHVLQSIPPRELERERGRVSRARGLLALQGSAFDEASRLLEASVKAGEATRDPRVLTELAKAEESAGRPQACVFALERLGPSKVASEETGRRLLKCQRASGDVSSAWKTARELRRRFESSASVIRDALDLEIELGLIESARLTAVRRSALARAPGEAMALAELFGRRGRVREAAQVLEAALLRFPEDPDLLLSLAQAEFRSGRSVSAAHLFERLAARDSSFYLQASELFRQNGWTTRAEYLHLFVKDSQERLKQKVGFALDQGRFSSVAAMTPSLSRAGLLEGGGSNDELVYASVYSRFRAGETEGLLSPLANLRKPELLEKSVALRKVIEACRKDAQTCRF